MQPCPHFDPKIIQRGKRQSAVAAAAYQSGGRLEDKLLKEIPASIQHQKIEIAALQQDAKTAEANPQVKDGFCGMTVKGMHFEDKLAAGERLLLACKEMSTAETVTLGSYSCPRCRS